MIPDSGDLNGLFFLLFFREYLIDSSRARVEHQSTPVGHTAHSCWTTVGYLFFDFFVGVLEVEPFVFSSLISTAACSLCALKHP